MSNFRDRDEIWYIKVMIPVKLSLRNFMSYQQGEIDFNLFNIACISGENGAGKSSLLEAISWAIWGKSRAASDDDLVYQGSEEMWVNLIFQSEKNLYRITRKRSRRGRGKTILEFQINSGNGNTKQKNALPVTGYGLREDWRSLTEPTIKETQNKIVDVLNLPYEVFTNSSYLRQGRADEFTVKSAGERKEILAKILNLDFYDRLAEKAKEKIQERENQEQVLTIKIQDLKEEAGQKEKIEAAFLVLQKKLDEKNKSKNKEEEKMEKLSTQKQRAELTKQKLDHIRSRYDEIRRDLKSALDEKNEIDNRCQKIIFSLREKEKIEKQIESLKILREKEEEYTNKLHFLSDLRPRLAAILSQEENLNETIARIKNISTCPTCLRTLSKEEEEKIIKALKNTIQAKIDPEKEKTNQAIKKLNYSKEDHLGLQRKIQDLREAEEKDKIIREAEAQIRELENRKQKLSFEIKDKKNRLEVLAKEGKEIAEDYKRFEGVLKAWEEQERKVYVIRREIETLREEYGQIKEQKTNIEKREKELQVTEKKLSEALKEKTIYEQLVSSYGRNGVQAMIIENTIPAIEEEANVLLERMTDGQMKVKFLTQRAKKHSEDMIETLDIQISDPIGARQYELFSGGEAFRINFAIRVALSKLLTLRAGAKLEFLAVDEGFGTLDQAGQQDLVAAINSISEDFSKIIVITHVQEIKNVFQNRLEVDKTDEGSHIQIVSG